MEDEQGPPKPVSSHTEYPPVPVNRCILLLEKDEELKAPVGQDAFLTHDRRKKLARRGVGGMCCFPMDCAVWCIADHRV